MKPKNLWIFILLVAAVLPLSACGSKTAVAEKIPPYMLEEIDGSDFKRVVLTEKAVERLDIQTAKVSMVQMDGVDYKVIPYAAVMYGLKGEAWTYTNPEPLVFVRQAIVIDHIEDDLAFIEEGPDIDTPVVIVGAPLLYGAEVGVSK